MALTPTRQRVWIRRYLLCEDDWAEFVSKHLFQHGHQFLVVQVLHAVEVIEVQEHDLSGMSRQEATDLFQTRSHLDKTHTNQKWKIVHECWEINKGTVQSIPVWKV